MYPFYWVEDTLKSQLVKSMPDMVDNMAWKNLTFDPAGRTVWLKIINSPVSAQGVTLGPYGDNEMRGFIQIGVYSKLDTGIELSREMIGRIETAFPIPSRLPTATGNLLRLTSKGYSQGGQTSVADFTRGGVEGNWDVQYITVYWLAREPKQRI